MRINIFRVRGKEKFLAFPGKGDGSYIEMKGGLLNFHVRDNKSRHQLEVFAVFLIQKGIIRFNKRDKKFEINSRHPLIVVERLKGFIRGFINLS
jgi:hypothetical protein